MHSIIYGDTEQWEVDATGEIVRRLRDDSYKKALMRSEIIPIMEEDDADTAYNYQIMSIEKSDTNESMFKLLLLRKHKVIKRKSKKDR